MREALRRTLAKFGEALRRTLAKFGEANLTDWAAALTYYAVLALFPALIAFVSVLGLIGDPVTGPLLDNLGELAPSTGGDVVRKSIESVAESQGAAGIGLVIGLSAALWSASGYVGGLSRASNAIYGVDEQRPFWKQRPLQIAVTALLVLALALCALAVVVTGPVTEELGKLLGIEGTALTAWDLAKWPVIGLVVAAVLSALYWASAPSVARSGFRIVTPGGILAVVLWLATSGLFSLYVANFSSYNATYGALAGVIVFLIWLWITNLAILLGAALNAELESGGPPAARA